MAIAASQPPSGRTPRGRGRIGCPSSARRFLDDRARCRTERALMSAMPGAVDQVADEIRIGLPASPCHADATATKSSALWHGGALDRPALILLLLRRATNNVAAASALPRASLRRTVERTSSGTATGAIASAAMAPGVARGRPPDRFGRSGRIYDVRGKPCSSTSSRRRCSRDRGPSVRRRIPGGRRAVARSP